MIDIWIDGLGQQHRGKQLVQKVEAGFYLWLGLGEHERTDALAQCLVYMQSNLSEEKLRCRFSERGFSELYQHIQSISNRRIWLERYYSMYLLNAIKPISINSDTQQEAEVIKKDAGSTSDYDVPIDDSLAQYFT
ncbi:hypothetical protein [uncultured Photobacterium sp.]|uniref:hypothetical protein n=1 Tax=uncultured Photobacterium sp. TaxID=173973 RepID=UPI002601E00F|nr:hypothetical protein [uncultured Photobacterium sp.]